MPVLSPPQCVMIIAGEASGDLHGAHLVRAMRERSNGLFFCGIGGRALREAGVRIVQDAASLSVVGITEVLGKLPHLVRGVTAAKRLLKHLRPELLILIDFPDFNLHVAATAKKLGIPTLYYISPQVWAWRAGRVKKIGRRVDHVAV
ncbi:MAG: lipid-A-disaccharide synthase, partial [Desulfobacterales bacterium]|nr:lipid-A-disaccharide synthase [Desulfobacterales bacterium]